MMIALRRREGSRGMGVERTWIRISVLELGSRMQEVRSTPENCDR